MNRKLCCLVAAYCICPACRFRMCYPCFETHVNGGAEKWGEINNNGLSRMAMICPECEVPVAWLQSDYDRF